jgi:hypothetical protein
MRGIVNEAKQYTGVYKKPRVSVVGLLVIGLFIGLGLWRWRDAPGEIYKIGAHAYGCPDRHSLQFVEDALSAGDNLADITAGCITLAAGSQVRRLPGTIEGDLVKHWRIQIDGHRPLWVSRYWLRNLDGSLIR